MYLGHPYCQAGRLLRAWNSRSLSLATSLSRAGHDAKGQGPVQDDKLGTEHEREGIEELAPELSQEDPVGSGCVDP